MKRQMSDKKSNQLIIIPILVVVALLTTFWAVSMPHGYVITSSSSLSGSSLLTPVGPNPADLEIYYVANSVLSSVNIVLLAFLTIKYVILYGKTKSQFTMVLLMFISVFLIKDIMSSPFVIGVFFQIAGLGPFALIEPLVELLALSFLLYLNLKY